MTTLEPVPTRVPQRTATVDVIIPVYNEEADLAASVLRLDRFLSETFPYSFGIVIADNASTDGTFGIAPAARRPAPVRPRRPSRREGTRPRAAPGVAGLRCGRGRLHGRGPVHGPEGAAAADRTPGVGSLRHRDRHPAGPRLAGSSAGRSGSSSRGPTTSFCGRRWVPRSRTPSAGSRRCAAMSPGSCCRWWRTTTGSSTPNCCVLAQRAGLRIHEVPVDWTDDPGTTVDIVATATEDLKGVWRLLRGVSRPGAFRSTGVRAELARPDVRPRCRGCRPGCSGSCCGSRRRRSRQHAGLLRALPAAASLRRSGGQPRVPADHRGVEHGSQPAVHLRSSEGRRAPSGTRSAA